MENRALPDCTDTEFQVFSLPLKTKENPLGIYTERELYSVMALGTARHSCPWYIGSLVI